MQPVAVMSKSSSISGAKLIQSKIDMYGYASNRNVLGTDKRVLTDKSK